MQAGRSSASGSRVRETREVGESSYPRGMSADPDPVILRWRVTWPDDPKTHHKDGACDDGDAPIGRVLTSDDARIPGWWSWTMTACGAGRRPYHSSGNTPTKQEAKAAVEACYHDLLAADPGNRASIQAHHATLRRSIEVFERRHERELPAMSVYGEVG